MGLRKGVSFPPCFFLFCTVYPNPQCLSQADDVLCLASQSCLTLCGLQPTRLLCPWGFSKQEYQSGLPRPPPGDLPNPGAEPRSPALQMDSLPGEPQGKPKNTGVGSLSLLQRICLIQERVLYLLSYQENLFLVYFTTTLKETPSAFIWVQFSL